MSTLMSALIVLLSNDLDDYWVSTTTAAGDAAKQYLVDDSLYEKVPDWVSDGMVVYLPLGPGGAGSPETRVVDSIQNNNQLVTKTAFSAQVATSVGYEIHRLFTRNQKLAALRQAATLVCPEIHAVVRDMSLVTIDNKYEYDISSLAIYRNRPHQVLIAQQTIRDIWVKATTYVADDYVRPTTLATFTGYVYKCTTAGTSHASTEPTWPTESAGTVTDGTVVWTRQDDLDYSNYPMLPLHDWDITPDGRLFLNATYTAGYKLMIVGIKPLAFTGSGAAETIALDSPFTLILSAQAVIWLCQQKISSAGTQDAARWIALKQQWEAELASRIVKYPMRAPDGTIITGPGLTV
jgi:hypothetical protein